MRLIDADALEAYLNKRHDDICERCGRYDSYAYGFGDALLIVETTQAVEDAVVVVRCKDCKHWHDGDCWRLELSFPNDYCSYGERKSDNE